MFLFIIFKNPFYYYFLTNGSRDSGLGEGKGGPSLTPPTPFPLILFIIHTQALGGGGEGNSLSGVGATKGPCPLRNQAPLPIGEGPSQEAGPVYSQGFSIQHRASGVEDYWYRLMCWVQKTPLR